MLGFDLVAASGFVTLEAIAGCLSAIDDGMELASVLVAGVLAKESRVRVRFRLSLLC